MIEIPRYMNNEHSKLVAAVVVEQRRSEIAQCKLNIAKAQLKRYYTEMNND